MRSLDRTGIPNLKPEAHTVATVAVTYKSTVPTGGGKVKKKADIDKRNLTFDEQDHASKSEPKGQHVLDWFIEGPKGTKYTIAITSPPESVWSHSATLGADGKDAGLKEFPVNS